MRRYAQYYKYDEVGNMLQMKHTTTGGTGNWTRDFDVDTASNKLLQCNVGSDGTGTESYTYDTRGNMTNGMNHLLSMTYNEENRLEKVEITASVTAYYQYESGGERVRKIIVNTGALTKQVRKYLGDWEVYQKINTGTNTVILERETLHVNDNGKRTALIDTPTVDTLSSGEVQLLRYQYSNNISTAALELDENAAVITYEEYYPYGNTSYQGGRSAAECSLKRYRYTGKERDEETGLNCHGVRYYAPWLARWCAAEPITSEWYGLLNNTDSGSFMAVVASSYEYCYDNPIRFIDPTGEQPGGIFDLIIEYIRNFFYLDEVFIKPKSNAKAGAQKSERNRPDAGNRQNEREEKKAKRREKRKQTWEKIKEKTAPIRKWIKDTVNKIGDKLKQAGNWINEKANERDDDRVNNDSVNQIAGGFAAGTFILSNVAGVLFDKQMGSVGETSELARVFAGKWG